MSARVKRLEVAILEVVKEAPESMQEVIRGLQALRGIAHISAVTIAAELGHVSSRFESARKLMGYSGAFPSENSSGKRKRQGGITKCGNARAPQTHRNGIGLVLSTLAQSWGEAAETAARDSARDHRNCLEGAEPPAQTLREVDHCR
jgi:hypothetical protein